MGIFNQFFGSKPGKISNISYEALAVDVHSHLLPGLDDGSESLEQSLQMLSGFKNLGFRKVITTPHVMMDSYKNSPEKISNALLEVKSAVLQAGLDIEIEAAAEYMVDDGFEKIIEEGQLMTIGKNYILIELSTFIPHPHLKEMLFNLQIDGYKIILGHAERYSYWYRNFKEFEELKSREILFQINTLSFGGFYNQDYRKMAEKLVNLGMVDLLGSDMHKPAQLNALARCRMSPFVEELISGGKLLNNII